MKQSLSTQKRISTRSIGEGCLKYTSLLLIFSSMALSGYGQTIKGTIINKDGQLPGATIKVANSSIGTSTNIDGTFSLNTQTTGKVSVEVSYIGHEVKTMELDVKQGINNIGNVELNAAGGQLGAVMITGTLAPSQAKAYSIKKNSNAIMDVLSADAIGKLPDRNAAEAVQRVQGVAVARYHGEADQATVRGTPFAWTSTLFNGNRMPSANVMGSRSTVLDVIPSEIIQYVQVAKAITPDIEGDAIGGSINFITRTAPQKRILNFSAAGGFNTLSQDGTYNGSVVYGDRFFKNKLGVIFSAAVWDRKWGTDSYDLTYNTGDSDPQKQKSINTVMLKRYMGTRQTYGANLGLEYKFNANHKLLFRGLMDKFNDIRPVYESYVDYTNSRYQYNYRYSHYQTVLNGGELGGEHQLGKKVNVDWSVSNYMSRFFLETPSTNDNKGLPIATFRQKITGGFSNLSSDGKMYWDFDSPDGKGLTKGSFDAGLTNPNEVMDPNKLTLQQLVIAQLDTKEEDKVGQINFKIDASQRLKFKVGVKYRHKYRESSFGSNMVYLPGALFGDTTAPALLKLSDLNTESFPTRAGYFNNLDGNLDQYAINTITKDQLFSLFDPAMLQQNGFRDFTSAANESNLYHGTEDVLAGYVMAEYSLTDRLKVIGGVRNEYTSMELKGATATTDKNRQTTITPSTVTNNYNALLPMLHFKYALSDRANLRAAYTRTFIRANFTDLTPATSTDNTSAVIVITKGNPDLKPTFSNNFDVMGEYYFKGIGLLSGGVFYKDISNVIFSDKTTYTDGTDNYLITQPKNFDNAKLYGFEIGISKRLNFLPGFLSGLGVEFNYTQIESETEVSRLVQNPDNSYTTVKDKISLPNQSKNLFNAILFYERNGITVRFAGNYRGASIETVNQQLGPDFYVWTDKNFTIDASAAVAVSKSIRVFAELNNLTNQPLRAYMGDSRRTTMTEWYGRRGQVGLRWDIIK